MYFYFKAVTIPTFIIYMAIFKSVNLESNHLLDILELKDNLFYTINEKVHGIVNRLFSILKLNSNFLKSSKINLLLTMHSDLNNIAVKNFDVFKEIIIESKVENSSDADNTSELKTILDQLIKEYRDEKQIINSTRVTEIITIDYNITNASSSVESLDFLEDFLGKINTLTEDNFTMGHSNATLSEELDMFSVNKRNTSDLKIWSPPTNIEKEELFNNLTRRIYKGKRTRIKSYPFMASIHVLNEFMCSGCIISKDFVITAASCLQIVYNNKKLRENPKNIHIRVGSDYTKRYGEVIKIKELHFHPQYESFNLKNNLLLLKMAEQIKFLKKKRKIRRIVYDKTPERLQGFDEVTILGWGANDNMIEVKTYQPLAVADIDVYDFNNCQEIYSKSYVTEKNFCVGFVSKGGGACKGDVGGPAVVNGVLMGIISFGPPVCGAVNMPTVLVKVGYYATWIDSVINQQSAATSATNLRTPAQITSETILTESTKLTDEIYPENPNYERTGMARDYPEEVAILNQILNEVILSNKTLIDDILYGALEDDFPDVFKPPSKKEIHEHPLVNKSLFLKPEVHDFGKQPQPSVTASLTTSSTIYTTPYHAHHVDNMVDYDERIRYWTALYPDAHLPRSPTTTTLATDRTPPTLKETRFFTDRFGRARKVTLPAFSMDEEKEYSKVVSSEDSEKISDNYESKKEVEDSEGISIEVTASEKYYGSKTIKPKRRPTGKVTAISSEREKEYEPKKVRPKTTRSLKMPYASKGIGFNYNMLRNKKQNGFVTRKQYKGRDRLGYAIDHNLYK